MSILNPIHCCVTYGKNANTGAWKDYLRYPQLTGDESCMVQMIVSMCHGMIERWETDDFTPTLKDVYHWAEVCENWDGSVSYRLRESEVVEIYKDYLGCNRCLFVVLKDVCDDCGQVAIEWTSFRTYHLIARTLDKD